MIWLFLLSFFYKKKTSSDVTSLFSSSLINTEEGLSSSEKYFTLSFNISEVIFFLKKNKIMNLVYIIKFNNTKQKKLLSYLVKMLRSIKAFHFVMSEVSYSYVTKSVQFVVNCLFIDLLSVTLDYKMYIYSIYNHYQKMYIMAMCWHCKLLPR